MTSCFVRCPFSICWLSFFASQEVYFKKHKFNTVPNVQLKNVDRWEPPVYLISVSPLPSLSGGTITILLFWFSHPSQLEERCLRSGYPKPAEVSDTQAIQWFLVGSHCSVVFHQDCPVCPQGGGGVGSRQEPVRGLLPARHWGEDLCHVHQDGDGDGHVHLDRASQGTQSHSMHVKIGMQRFIWGGDKKSMA